MTLASNQTTLLDRKRLLASLAAVCTVALLCALVLLVKSSLDFSRSGPAIRKEVLDNFKLYTVYAMARLAGWTFLLAALSSLVGTIGYWCLLATSGSASGLPRHCSPAPPAWAACSVFSSAGISSSCRAASPKPPCTG